MYQKIVVPLDGSKLAECVLPYVEELAKGCNTEEVTLISVTERVSGRTTIGELSQPAGTPLPVRFLPPSALGYRLVPVRPLATKVPVVMGKMLRQAERYLGRIAKRLEKKGIKVRCEVLLGNPAEEITVFAEQSDAGLIAMASHGRSGPSRWAHGSVADRVFRASSIPVLMVKARGV